MKQAQEGEEGGRKTGWSMGIPRTAHVCWPLALRAVQVEDGKSYLGVIDKGGKN